MKTTFAGLDMGSEDFAADVGRSLESVEKLLLEELSESAESSNDSTDSAVERYVSFQPLLLPCSEAALQLRDIVSIEKSVVG